MHHPGELLTSQWSWHSESQVLGGILGALTLGCLGLSPKRPMWFQWAAVSISGWLSPFSWEPVPHSPSSLSAHSPCFYIQQHISTAFTMPPDRRKITNSFHTRLNWRDLCPKQARSQYDRGSNSASQFYCGELLCVHPAVSAGLIGRYHKSILLSVILASWDPGSQRSLYLWVPGSLVLPHLYATWRLL